MSNDQEKQDKNAPSASTDRLPNKVVHNQTARRIAIPDKEDGDSQFVLPPFGKRTIPPDELALFNYEPQKHQGLISIEDEATDEVDSAYLALGCLVWVFLVGIPLGLLVPGLRVSHLYWGIFGGTILTVLVIVFSGKLRQVRQWIAQSFSLTLILAIGIGLPALVIYFFGGGQELLTLEQLRQSSLALLGRGLQLTFIVVASLLPALLYFLFDRQQLGTLQENFFRDVILLDPNVKTLGDAKGMYGKQVKEVYGLEEGASSKGRLLHGTRWPILMATLVITLGWILTLLPVGPVPADLHPGDLYTLLTPRLTAVNFGFLGAYFFAINLILRRYVRADLKPKAYSHITVRFLVTIVLVWTLSVLPQFWNNVTDGISNITDGIVHLTQQATPEPIPTAVARPGTADDDQTPDAAQPSGGEPSSVSPGEEDEEQTPQEASPLLLLLVFFVGIVPETGTAVIQEYLRNQEWLKNRIPSLQEKHPLNQLEGISLYDRARLLEEGIENIENLVHHDLIDLMLQTRIPVPRLVDWIDQGILYLHLVEDEEKKTEPPVSSLQTLRKYGIRTATDMERAYEAAKERDDRAKANGKETKELEHLLGILDVAGAKVKRLQVILDTLRDDEWLAHIHHWRDLRRFQGPNQ